MLIFDFLIVNFFLIKKPNKGEDLFKWFIINDLYVNRFFFITTHLTRKINTIFRLIKFKFTKIC